MKRRVVSWILVCVLCMVAATEAVGAAGPVIISEVQTGSVTDATHELVELHNLSSTAQNISDWRLEYISASGKSITKLADLSGSMTAHGTLLLTSKDNPGPGDVRFDGGLSSSGGHVRLRNDGGEVIDMVSWGDLKASEVAVPMLGSPIAAPGDCQVIRRSTDNQALSLQTARYAAQESQCQAPAPAPTPGNSPSPSGNPSQCQGIILSELLPNPTGTDTNQEFIEVYNSTTTPQSLQGCSLKTSNDGKTYALPIDPALPPGARRAFYSQTTDLRLTNTGGEVWLVTPGSEVVTKYPAAASGQAWALINDTWQATQAPTPNQPNILQTTPGKVKTAATSSSAAVEACPAGKERNPATNRCKSAEEASTLAACSPGQTRNPDTNRCRAASTSSASTSALKACQPGFERNPQTNRCRQTNVLATNTLKPCAVGQERNPLTNRCRKSVLASATTAKKAGPNDQNSSPALHHGVLVGVAALVLGYGAFEYRHDLAIQWARLQSRRHQKQK